MTGAFNPEYTELVDRVLLAQSYKESKKAGTLVVSVSKLVGHETSSHIL